MFFFLFFSKFFSFFAFVFSKGRISSIGRNNHPSFPHDGDEQKKRRAQTAGFEPTHALRIRFLVEPLNRSGTSATIKLRDGRLMNNFILEFSFSLQGLKN